MSEPLEALPAKQRAWLDRVAEASHQDVMTVVSVLIGVVMYDPSFRRFPPKTSALTALLMRNAPKAQRGTGIRLRVILLRKR